MFCPTGGLVLFLRLMDEKLNPSVEPRGGWERVLVWERTGGSFEEPEVLNRQEQKLGPASHRTLLLEHEHERESDRARRENRQRT